MGRAASCFRPNGCGGAPIRRRLGARRLANVALRRAAGLAREGRDEEAARAVLDVLSMGRDLAHGSSLFITEFVGLAVVEIGCDALDPARGAVGGVAIEFGPRGTAVLAAGLARLDEGFSPHGPGWGGELVLLGRAPETAYHGEDAGGSPSGLPGIFARWGWGGPSPGEHAEALRARREHARAIAALEVAPWSRASGALAALDEEGEALAPLEAPSTYALGVARRRAIARLRLARAVPGAALGEALDLADPYGDRLLSEDTPAGRRWWSVGPDGRDGGGTPESDDLAVGG